MVVVESLIDLERRCFRWRRWKVASIWLPRTVCRIDEADYERVVRITRRRDWRPVCFSRAGTRSKSNAGTPIRGGGREASETRSAEKGLVYASALQCLGINNEQRLRLNAADASTPQALDECPRRGEGKMGQTRDGSLIASPRGGSSAVGAEMSRTQHDSAMVAGRNG